MSGLDKSIVGRIVKSGEKFELLLDKEKTYLYIEGKKQDLANILVVEEVFKDAKKGDRAGPLALKKAFDTDDIFVILEEVLKKGEIQLTTDQKKKMQQDKMKQVISLIVMNCIDVRTKAPVTQKRVELALDEIRFSADPFKKAEEQMEEVLSKLKLLLPLKIEKVKVAIKIPAAYSNRAYGFLKSYNLKGEEWTRSGDLVVLVEIPAGMQGEFFDKLNKMTRGEVKTKIVEK